MGTSKLAAVSRVGIFAAAILSALITGAFAKTLAPPTQSLLNPPSDIRFIENRGQVADTKGHPRPDLLYYTQGSHGVRMYFGAGGVSYVFSHVDSGASTNGIVRYTRRRGAGRGAQLCAPTTRFDPVQKLYRTDMNLLGANAAEIIRDGESSDYENFYYAHCPNGVTYVHSYSTLTYKNIYRNVDLIYRQQSGNVKYDFVVRPGGNVADIRLAYSGVDAMDLSADGQVQVATPMGSITEDAPYTYQTPVGESVTDIFGVSTTKEHDGAAQPIVSTYHLVNNVLSFDIGDYDHTQPLVIDPSLAWCTLYGGSAEDGCGSISIDPRNNAVTVVSTRSTDFPTSVGALQVTYGGGLYDAGIVKFNTNGMRKWATYVGGSDKDFGNGLATDTGGNVYLVGATASRNFPVTSGAFQTVYQGTVTNGTTPFLFKVDTAGMRLWATFYGGTYNDVGIAVTTDLSGNAVIVGSAQSDNLPVTAGAFQSQLGGTKGQVDNTFIVKFDGAGNRQWATYFGGNTYDYPTAVAVDSKGNIAFTGCSESPNFPASPSAFQSTQGGDGDAFVVKLDSNGNRLWATLYGGSTYAWDEGYGVSFDHAGNIIFAGGTSSRDFPTTTGAFQTTCKVYGSGNAFVVKFDGSGNRLWATYYGNANDVAYGTAIDANDNIGIVGECTKDTLFPVTSDAFQDSLPPTSGFIVVLNKSGGRVWASQFGSADSMSWAYGMAFDSSNNVYVSGYTFAAGPDFPVTPGAYQTHNNGGADGFVAKFCNLQFSLSPGTNDSICKGSSVQIGVTAPGPASQYSYQWQPTAGLSVSTGPTVIASPNVTTTYYETVTNQSGCVQVDSFVVAIRPAPKVTFLSTPNICKGTGTQLNATVSGGSGPYSYLWIPSNGLSAINVLSPVAKPDSTTKYFVHTTDAHGCTGVDSIVVRVNQPPVLRPSDFANQTICPGSSVTIGGVPLNGTPPFRYSWTPSAGLSSTTVAAPVAKPISATNYVVVVTDSNGCQSRGQLTVFIGSSAKPVIASGGPTTLCPGDSVQLTASPGYATYHWSNGDTTQIITVKKSGSYAVTVSDSTVCPSTSDSVTVTVRPAPSPTISGVMSVCANAAVVYSVANISGDVYTWTVTGGTITAGAGTNSITVLWGPGGTGTVNLIETSGASHCIGDAPQITVQIGGAIVPTITSSGALSFCTGDSVMLSAPSGFVSYLWSDGETTQSIEVNTSGVFSVTVTTAGSCQGTSISIVVAVGNSVVPVISAFSSLTFCVGDSVTLDAGGGYDTYLWSTGATSETITVKTAGTYNVAVSKGTCSGQSQPVTVSVGNSLTPVITGATAFCPGDSTTLDAGSGYDAYLWSTGATTQTITVNTAGMFHVAVSNGACRGQSQDISVTVFPTPTATITANGNVLAASAASTYQWYLNANPIPGATSQTYTAVAPGDYTVRITDANGCPAQSVIYTIATGGGQTPIIVQLPMITSTIGAHVSIPFALKTSQSLASFGTVHYTAVLHYDLTVLAKQDTFTSKNTPTNRYVYLSGTLPDTSGTLATLQCQALLGDADTIPLVIDSFTVDNANITVQRIDGELDLIPICGLSQVSFIGAPTLSQNAPNPFSQTSVVNYTLPSAGEADLFVVDILGRTLATIASGTKPAGQYSATLDAAALSSGLYFYVLQTPGQIVRRPFQVEK